MSNIYFIILSILFILYILHNIRKNDFSIKESFLWVMGCIIILILSITSKPIDFLAKKLNVAYPPSLLFTLAILFLIFMNFRNIKKIVHLEEKVTALTQETAILKEENNEKK